MAPLALALGCATPAQGPASREKSDAAAPGPALEEAGANGAVPGLASIVRVDRATRVLRLVVVVVGQGAGAAIQEIQRGLRQPDRWCRGEVART